MALKCFYVVLFTVLYNFYGVGFECVDENRKCRYSNENYWAVLSCGAVDYAYYVVVAVQGDSNFWVSAWNPKVWPLKWVLLKNYFPVVLVFVCLFVCLFVFFCFEKRGYDFRVCGWSPQQEWVFRWKLSAVLFVVLYKMFLTFESVEDIIKCDNSNESFEAVLFAFQ